VTDSHPRVLTQRQVRFDIWFELSQVPASLVRAWAGKDREKSQVAQDQIAERVSTRFERYQVRAPEPQGNPMAGIGNGRVGE